MTQQLLNRADTVAVFQQVCCKRMPQRMTARGLGEPGFPDRLFDRLLEYGLMEVETLLALDR